MQTRPTIEFNFRDRQSRVLRDGPNATQRVSLQGEFEELRAYIPWDEARSIDMLRSQFESGVLVTRSYRESREFTLSIWILLDQSFRFGTLEWTKLQVLQSALQLIGESLISAGHRGEIVVLWADGSELLPFASVSEMAHAMVRVNDLVRGNSPCKFLLATSPSSRGGVGSVWDLPWTHHISRLTQNPDSKVALFTSETSNPQLRAELAQKNKDLHEFVIEHPEEFYQNEWLIERTLRALHTLKSPGAHPFELRQTFSQNGSITILSHPTLLTPWLQQGFRYRPV